MVLATNQRQRRGLVLYRHGFPFVGNEQSSYVCHVGLFDSIHVRYGGSLASDTSATKVSKPLALPHLEMAEKCSCRMENPRSIACPSYACFGCDGSRLAASWRGSCSRGLDRSDCRQVFEREVLCYVRVVNKQKLPGGDFAFNLRGLFGWLVHLLILVS